MFRGRVPRFIYLDLVFIGGQMQARSGRLSGAKISIRDFASVRIGIPLHDTRTPILGPRQFMKRRIVHEVYIPRFPAYSVCLNPT
jgi:hypothetical protein